jgi:hypothetical protein
MASGINLSPDQINSENKNAKKKLKNLKPLNKHTA